MSETSDDGSKARGGGYVVGKGKPPKEHQFKPNQSGNPRGRPKNRRSVEEEVKHHLDGSISVRTPGGTKKMPRRKVLVQTLFERAAKGDNRATELLLRYDLAARAPVEGLVQQDRPQDPDDQATIEAYIAGLSQTEGGQ